MHDDNDDDDLPGVTVRELARRTGIARPTLARYLAALDVELTRIRTEQGQHWPGVPERDLEALLPKLAGLHGRRREANLGTWAQPGHRGPRRRLPAEETT